LLRQGWIFLFGPVLFYDLVRSARRTRTYVVRIIYLLLLFGLLCWLYWVWLDRTNYRDTTSKDIAEFTQMFFVIFLSAQLIIVVLLTPAYVAGAITDEKERKTIEYILATDLRSREIVLGKYVARLLHLSVLILAGLPILSAVQFMGGIDPNLLLAGYAGTALTIASIAGISMFASTVTRRTRDAILIVYLAILVYFGLWAFAEGLNGAWGSSTFPSTRAWRSPVTVGDCFQALVSFFRIGNPGYAIYQVTKTGTVVGSTVWSVLEEYAIFHGALAVGGILGSMALLRRAALMQPQTARARRTWMGLGSKRRLPPIGNYPMLWKEVFAERGFRMHIVLRFLFVLLVILSLVPLFFILYFFLEEVGSRSYYGRDPWRMLGEATNGYVRGVGMLVAMLGVIGVSVRAATSVRGERDRDTLDALLTSPMGSEEILFGKWIGSVLSVRWVAIWLLAIWAVGLLTGGLNLLMLPLMAIAWLIYLGAAASLGLWYSVTSRSTLAAILKTLLAGLLLSCGHWIIWLCCIPMQIGFRGAFEDVVSTIAQIQAGITPPVVLSFTLPFSTEQLFEGHDMRRLTPIKLIIFSMGGAFCWGIFAWGVWQATNERFKKLTFRAGKRVREEYPRAVVLSSWPEK